MCVPQNPLVKNLFVKTVRMVALEIAVTIVQDLATKNSLAKALVQFANAMVTQKNAQLIQMGILYAKTVNMVLLEIRFEHFTYKAGLATSCMSKISTRNLIK